MKSHAGRAARTKVILKRPHQALPAQLAGSVIAEQAARAEEADHTLAVGGQTILVVDEAWAVLGLETVTGWLQAASSAPLRPSDVSVRVSNEGRFLMTFH